MIQQVQWNKISREKQKKVLQRAAQAKNRDIRAVVLQIVGKVKKQGDAALRQFAEKFDRVALKNFKVGEQEFSPAAKKVPQDVKNALKNAARNIERFHAAQKRGDIRVQTQKGIRCVFMSRPIQKIGFYVPGGTAVLPSTLLMLGIPSRIAGCEERILCTPPRKDGEIDATLLYAAQLCGIRDIYKIGGAQAIAAMAYGTRTIPKVDKIFGPGNAYVTEAKVIVSQDIEGSAIDMPAGPSEVMVIADAGASAAFIAMDMLSQAEHDVNSQAILVTNSFSLAKKAQVEIQKQMPTLPRKIIAQASIRKNGKIILVSSMEQAFDVANAYAPEHLIVQTKNPQKYLRKIQNAGSVFLGEWSPESVGDYASGTNHVLPTYGYAKMFGGVSLASFMKTMTVQQLTREGLKGIAATVLKLTEVEKLEAHRRAVEIRMR